MADAAARRDARRRRILENSESRLQRISGQINNDNVTDDEKKCHKSDLPSILMDLNTNGVSPSELLINSSRDGPIKIENQTIEADSQSNVIFTATERHFTSENVCNDNGSIHSQSQNKHNAEKFHNILQNSPNQKQIIPPGNIINDEKIEAQSIFMKIIINRSAVYIIFAAIMNIILILKRENSFGISIAVPFFLIFSGRLCIIGQYNDTQRNNTTHSMIIAALILCNVRPNVIYTLKKIFNIANQLINDLAIFIFSFVFMYYIISRYWIDFDALLANKIEIIVDRHATT